MTADQALRMALEGAAADAYALEEAIGESEAFFDAFPDAYTFTGADGVTEHTFEALKCTFASSSHSDRHVVECKTCAWRERYGNLPRDPCLMYVVPPLCPVCRFHGEVSGVRSRYPAESDKPHAVAPDADDAGLIPDGGVFAGDATVSFSHEGDMENVRVVDQSASLTLTDGLEPAADSREAIEAGRREFSFSVELDVEEDADAVDFLRWLLGGEP